MVPVLSGVFAGDGDGKVDLNSGSFYTVETTGENILKVNRGTKK